MVELVRLVSAIAPFIQICMAREEADAQRREAEIRIRAELEKLNTQYRMFRLALEGVIALERERTRRFQIVMKSLTSWSPWIRAWDPDERLALIELLKVIESSSSSSLPAGFLGWSES